MLVYAVFVGFVSGCVGVGFCWLIWVGLNSCSLGLICVCLGDLLFIDSCCCGKSVGFGLFRGVVVVWVTCVVVCFFGGLRLWC